MRISLLVLLLAVGLMACDTNSGCEDGTLQVQEVVIGEGAEASESSTVTVAYEGRLASSGAVFDASEGATFALSNTIPGFRDGIEGMLEGGERQLTIPPNLAYGEEGIPGTIPGCATLIFDVELVEVLN